ncbi:pyrroline-5-carboxylate reductase [Halalkalibacter nanhaiisediminis]|uniref:Pyrroline-5-carboxylate reductase n=1 Tax=Halalkalibacter nanhaiisediminis TaxID=688079 RepID=A0A562QEG6_9BACI|nr:pyrroline-5-carboxylate reductase [Halalkalibacter nanhaiisediminis]TWI54436.1 pyrroline-5-carboxylate reductase [Halalkalibacter nanhaiisediminis]
MNNVHILFIGAGRMAEAIFSGILTHQPEIMITVSNQSNSAHLDLLQSNYPIQTTSSWTEVIDQVDVILLACPPGAHSEVLQKMSLLLKKGQLVVTVAAGIGPSKLEAALPKGTPVAWLMPNTAADVGKSMSIYAYGSAITDTHRNIFEKVVSAIGPSEELSEEQVHNLTAVTGSAPAFLYSFVEALEQTATKYGLTAEQARKLVIEMVIGSAAMLAKHRDPAKLREQVTSPGGATAAGLTSLANDQFSDSIIRAIHATNARAKELGS